MDINFIQLDIEEILVLSITQFYIYDTKSNEVETCEIKNNIIYYRDFNGLTEWSRKPKHFINDVQDYLKANLYKNTYILNKE
jgi:hypothetical protein